MNTGIVTQQHLIFHSPTNDYLGYYFIVCVPQTLGLGLVIVQFQSKTLQDFAKKQLLIKIPMGLQ